MAFRNRVTKLLGIETPIVQAPMCWITRSQLAAAAESPVHQNWKNVMTEFGTATDLYFGGDMEASTTLTGQVAGRIDSVRPVAEVIQEVRAEFFDVVGKFSKQCLN